MKKAIIGIIVLLILSCNDKSTVEFSLNGTTNGIDSGTVLYLDNVLADELLDSAIIQNNSFNFKTKLPETPLQVVLRTKDYSHYRFLWLENAPMTFDQTKSDFRNAIVTGSEPENLSQSLNQKIGALERDEQLKKEMEFVKNNPNSIVSANILSVYTSTWGKEKTMELFDLFSTENKNSEYGKRISKYIELNKNPQIGEKFVDFEMENYKGTNKRLSDIKGKATLLEFWASWCGPCRKENPNLVKTYEKFHPKGFEIFAVSLDKNKASWLKAIEKDGLTWEHVSDLNGAENTAGLIYGVSGIPDNFLINEKGIIVGRNLRGESLNKKLDELLN